MQDNTTGATQSSDAQCTTAKSGAIVVGSGVSRWGEPITCIEKAWTKISAKDTSGNWSFFEAVVPPGFGVPLHLHHSQEEWFWVLSGDFLFEVGGEIFRLSAGMSLLGPREIPHRWRSMSASDGRLLIMVQPSGRMEEFFEALYLLSDEQRLDAQRIERLFQDCGMELLGTALEGAQF